jgi:hypothetical protein
MARRRLALFLIVLAVIVILPSITYGQSASYSGLVPCGVSSNPLDATECQACHLVSLAQNVIMFLIGLSIPIAALMFAWAGILYFTSGAGGSENISRAKKIFSTTLFGFVLAITAWLIINTLLFTILDKQQFQNSSWFKIDCSTAERPRDRDIGQVLLNHLGLAPPVEQRPVVISYECSPGQTVKTIQGGERVCVDSAGNIIGAAKNTTTFVGGSGIVCADGNTACSPQALMSATGILQARANALSCIAVTESSGNPLARNPLEGSTACGTFQVVRSSWRSVSGCGDHATSCTNAACNMAVAVVLGNERKARGGSFYGDWTCPNCNSKAAACVNKFDPGN